MSSQPFPTIFGGLAQGLETGMKLGLMKEEIETKKETIAYDKELNTTRQELKTLNSYQTQAEKLPIEGRPEYWDSILDSGTINSPYGREVLKVYRDTDSKTVKSIQTEQAIMDEAFRKKDSPTLRAHLPVLMGLLGKDSPAGKALDGTMERFETGEALNLVSKERELRDIIESGKLGGKELEDAKKIRDDLFNQIMDFPRASIEFAKINMMEFAERYGIGLRSKADREQAVRAPKNPISEIVNEVNPNNPNLVKPYKVYRDPVTLKELKRVPLSNNWVPKTSDPFGLSGEYPSGEEAPAPEGTSPSPENSKFTEGQTATNPQTGQKMIFKGGQWQPVAK